MNTGSYYDSDQCIWPYSISIQKWWKIYGCFYVKSLKYLYFQIKVYTTEMSVHPHGLWHYPLPPLKTQLILAYLSNAYMYCTMYNVCGVKRTKPTEQLFESCWLVSCSLENRNVNCFVKSATTLMQSYFYAKVVQFHVSFNPSHVLFADQNESVRYASVLHSSFKVDVHCWIKNTQKLMFWRAYLKDSSLRTASWP